ncbi:MAG: hypothetical protein AAB425_07675, partial [Bdellovibrionota bacterium]
MTLLPLIAAFALALTPAQAGSSTENTKIEAPCDADSPITELGDEEWTMSTRVPESWRKMVEEAVSDQKPALTFLWIGGMLKNAQVSNEAKMFGTYLIARNLDRLRLAHAAFETYQSIFNATSGTDTQSIRMAAAQCLARLQSTFPSLELSSTSQTSLTRIDSGPVRNSLAFRAFTQSRNIGPVKGTGATESLAQAILSAQTGADAKAAVLFRKFFEHSDADWEDLGLKSRRDSAQLMYGYTLHGKQDYAEAILQFQKVPNASNLFPDALRSKAWSELLSGQLELALGSAENFIVGSFRNQFSPSSYLIAAITLNETCNFSEANDLITKFKKRYQLVYSWLKYWDQRFTTRASKPYQVLVQYLGKKQKVLEPIAQEWIKT